MALVTLTDLAAYLRVSLADLDEPAAVLLNDLAAGLFVELVGPMPVPLPAQVRASALEVVARAYRNPEGYTSETVGEYTYRRGQAGSGVYLTPAEVVAMREAVAPTSTSRVRSVRLSAYGE